jgi:hypothetical protein
MTRVRDLILVAGAILLTGCAMPCARPDKLATDPVISCFYQITITDVDLNNYVVTGTLPDVLSLVVSKGEGKEIQYSRRSIRRDEHNPQPLGPFTFRVRDLDKLASQLTRNQTYEFIRTGNSPYLELLTGGPLVIQ